MGAWNYSLEEECVIWAESHSDVQNECSSVAGGWRTSLGSAQTSCERQSQEAAHGWGVCVCGIQQRYFLGWIHSGEERFMSKTQSLQEE